MPKLSALRPERRTRADLIAVLVIALVVALGAAAVWWTSAERATTSITAPPGGEAPASAQAVPDALAALWQQPSDATQSPVVLGSTVVTADGGAVVGRDHSTGAQRWRYGRDRPLCGVVGAWQMAVTVFRTANGCSEVTALHADTGARGPQRSSNGDSQISLQANDTFVTAFGDTRLESWRNDLVRTVEFGRVDAPVNPGVQPRSGCLLRSAATSPKQIALLERCPDDAGERLTAMAPDPEDSTKPDVRGSLVLLHDDQHVEGARVLATTAERTAVLIPSPRPAVVVFDAVGATLAESSLPVDALPPAADQGTLGPAAKAGPVLTFWTGSATVALDATTLETLWTRPGTLGPGTMMAGRLLLPVPDGIAVADPWTGLGARVIPVDRGELEPAGEASLITTAVAGAVVLEQRGDRVFALGPA